MSKEVYGEFEYYKCPKCGGIRFYASRKGKLFKCQQCKTIAKPKVFRKEYDEYTLEYGKRIQFCELMKQSEIHSLNMERYGVPISLKKSKVIKKHDFDAIIFSGVFNKRED